MGSLQGIIRNDTGALVRRHGGCVTILPSQKTDGIRPETNPSKLSKIAEMSLKIIEDDGIFDLIRTIQRG
jgi:BRCT domain type II-containing protein